jgi:hypothetical protein
VFQVVAYTGLTRRDAWEAPLYELEQIMEEVAERIKNTPRLF